VPLPSLTRRSTIGAALAAVAVLAGCEAGEDAGAGTRTAPATTGTPATGSTATDPGEPGTDATTDVAVDDALVDEVSTQIDARLALVAAVSDRSPWLARPLVPLARTHEAHRRQLPAGEPTPVPEVPRDPAAQWAQLRRQEAALVRALGQAAGDARSGTLARLFASMSAGTAAHLAALPEQPPTRRGGAA
jgi:hypothetical protein